MAYCFDIYNTIRIGIIIKTDDAIFDNYLLILDEDNQLWYAEKWANHITTNQMVCFIGGDNYKALDVKLLPNSLTYQGKHYEGNIDGNDKKGINGISNKEIRNVLNGFDFVEVYCGSCQAQNSIIGLHYIKDDIALFNRYFITDERNKAYKEFNEATVSLYDLALERNDTNNEIYPIDIDKASSIYSFVSNFNPYEVFESYRVEFVQNNQSRVGWGDSFFECKKYSIKYHDDYLSRWFKKTEVIFNPQEGHSSSLNHAASRVRLFNEENEAKSKAYAEYSRQEHFDTLMSSFYNSIQSHLKKIGNRYYQYPKTIHQYPKTIFHHNDADEIKIKEAYSWLYQNITTPLRNSSFVEPKTNQSQEQRYEEIIIEALKGYIN